ncbi:hypothetical protein D3C76_841700 [compost metagenome]
MRQASAGGGLRQRAVDHAVHVGCAHGGFGGHAVEAVTLVVLGQGDGLQVTDLAVQAGQLAVRTQFELEFLPMLELAELLGLFAAGQHVMYRRGWKADFLEQRGERVAFADDHFPVIGRLLFFGNRCGGCYRRGCGCGLSCLLGLLRAVFDLRKRRRDRIICGLDGFCSVLFLCQLFSRAFQFKAQGCLFGFYITGRKYQKRQAQKGGDATRCEQVGLRVKRWRFRRFFGHK